MPTNPISPLPTPPSRNDDPDTFVTRSDAFIGALPVFVSQTNQLAGDIETDAGIINGAIEQAEDAASDALESAAAASDSADAAALSEDNAEIFAAAAGDAIGLPALEGNGLKSLRVNTAEDGVEFAAAIASEYQEFLSSGTWTKPADVTWVYVEVVGGGEAGASSRTNNPGRGGVGGAFNARLFRASELPSSVVATVGAGGQAITPANGSTAVGEAGSPSSFGDLLFAYGGKGIEDGRADDSPGTVSPYFPFYFFGAPPIVGPILGRPGVPPAPPGFGGPRSANGGPGGERRSGGDPKSAGGDGGSISQAEGGGGTGAPITPEDGAGIDGSSGGPFQGGGGGGGSDDDDFPAGNGGNGGTASGGGGGGCQETSADAPGGGIGGSGGPGIIRVWAW